MNDTLGSRRWQIVGSVLVAALIAVGTIAAVAARLPALQQEFPEFEDAAEERSEAEQEAAQEAAEAAEEAAEERNDLRQR